MSAATGTAPETHAAKLRRSFAFVVAGGTGFVVDAAVLQLLARGLGVEVHLARVGSFLCAVTATWLINRHFTFQARRPGQGLAAEWFRYLLSSLVGGAVNYAAFAVALHLLPVVRAHLVIGVAIGSLAGMVVNYLLYSRFVFGRKASASPDPRR